MSEPQPMCLSSLKSICRCCHSDGNFYSLKEPYKFRGKVEVYNRMLIEAFGILISPPTIAASYTICNSCIIRLRDSAKFRHQIEACEEKFSEYCQLFFDLDVPNDDDLESKVEIKINAFINSETVVVNNDVNVEKEDDAIKNENVTITDTDDGLSNGDEVQNLDVEINGDEVQNLDVESNGDEVQNLDVEDGGLDTVEYETGNIELGNVDVNKDNDNEMENLADDLSVADIAVDSLKKHLTGPENENMVGCILCPMKFISEDLLKEHFKEHNNQKYKCNDCGHSFDSLIRLQNHSKNIHNNISLKEDTSTNKDKNGVQYVKVSNYLTCRFCKKRVQGSGYERHLKTHVGKTECINCGEIFDSIDLLIEHSKTHKYENMCTCDFCKKQFIKKNTLKRHIDIHHMGKDRKFMCHECGGLFNDITNLRSHTTTVHLKQKMFECSVCQQKLSSNKSLKHHMRRHTGERPYVCDECEKRFASLASLKKHKIRHADMKKYDTNYFCKICHMTFLRQRQLTHHVRTKHPECLPITTKRHKVNYFPCPSCNKVFTQKSSRDRHVATKHEVIHKVTCDLCNKMFVDKSSLYRHIRNVHNSKEIKEKVQCTLCKRKVQDIDNHMTVHTTRPMQCETCGKNYCDEVNLHRHIKNVHHGGDKIFKCKKCDRRPFSKKKTLRNHMMKKHGCDLKAE